MSRRLDPLLVGSRALIAGSMFFFLGVFGHVSADGLLPGLPVLSLLLALSVLFSWFLLFRPASRLRLVALLVGGQAYVHTVLSATAGHTGGHGSATTPASGSPWEFASHWVADLATHAPMMAAHCVAALLVGLWLAHGEAALWTVVELAGARVVGLVRVVTPLPLPDGPRVSAHRQLDHFVPGPLWRGSPQAQRGPPLPVV